jgi:hypothetical protein
MKKILFQIGFLLVISLSTYAQELGISNINATGKLKVNGNAGTPGQVLTSNGAAASPTWNTSTSPPVFGGKFLITQGVVNNTTTQPGNLFEIGPTVSFTQTAFIDFSAINYNTNNDIAIDLVNDRLTINRSGLYHFEGLVRYFVDFNGSVPLPPKGAIGFKVGSSSVVLTNEGFLYEERNTQFANGISFKMDIYLLATQTIKFGVQIFSNNLGNAQGLGITSGSAISGYFVSE